MNLFSTEKVFNLHNDNFVAFMSHLPNRQLPCFVDQQEPTAEEFEDKDWTFVIENVSSLFITLLNMLTPFHLLSATLQESLM